MRGLKYISWGDNTGYATAAKSYVAALAEAGANISWSPMVPGPNLYEPAWGPISPAPSLQHVYHREIEYDRVIIHTVPEYYAEWMARERRPGRLIYGYTVWELEKLPRHWPEIINQLDGLMVPCQWNASVFRDSGVRVPIYVVPHLSQFEHAPPPSSMDAERLLNRFKGHETSVKDSFIFYTIGFWSHRKAPYLAIEAYWKAFSHDEPVLMIVKTSNKDITRWHRNWRHGFRLRHPSPVHTIERMMEKSGKKLPPVALIADESLSDGEMQSLHSLGDCFISLTRTEGWGLGAFEAARLGNPVIMTAYGGQSDYLSADQSHLIRYDMVPVHEPTWSASYTPRDHWAAPDIDQAAACMREIFDRPGTARAKAARQAEYIGQKFSRNSTIRTLLEILD